MKQRISSKYQYIQRLKGNNSNNNQKNSGEDIESYGVLCLWSDSIGSDEAVFTKETILEDSIFPS
jgi:hypothetical protein